jgi:NAD(P)-dependent dehydrogenase (short-subunit alcohol dehydrogenase family)
MPALKAAGNSRVITVTAPSTTKLNFGDLQGEKKFTALNAFGASKMANLLFTYTLARTSKENGITATAFFPGLVKSELTNEMPAFLRFFLKLISSSPDKASKAISKLALAPEYQNANGKFFDKNGKELKSDPYSYDVNMQDRLQTISETLIK